MDSISILTVISGTLTAFLSAFWVWASARSREKVKEALTAAREPKVDQALYQGDLKSLGEYFFNSLGQLPLSKYADDGEARSVVSEAVRNVDIFVNTDRSSAAEDPGLLGQLDAKRVESDIAMGDFWGGLSRLRRLIETSLRKAALDSGVPVGRMGPNQLLKRLATAEVVPPSAAMSLRRAIDICNRGVHGEPVSGEEAEEALVLAADGIASLEQAE